MPRTLDSGGSCRAKPPRKPLGPKAVYSPDRDTEFQTHAEREIFEEWFGDDYGKIVLPASGSGGGDEDEDTDAFQEAPAKRCRTSLESYVPIAPPKQVPMTDDLVDSMESYVFDMQEILDSLGLSSNQPDVPATVAAALSAPAEPKTDKRNVSTSIPKADVDEVLARMRSNQIMRDMTSWHDDLCEVWKHDQTKSVDLGRHVEPNLGDIYDLSKMSSEVAFLEAFKMATLFAYHCISLLRNAKVTTWTHIKDVIRLLEPADLLAKHCALKLWKNNWHQFVSWERYLKELRADLADAKEWYGESGYMRRTIEFIGRI
jgi:hypothetical protein